MSGSGASERLVRRDADYYYGACCVNSEDCMDEVAKELTEGQTDKLDEKTAFYKTASTDIEATRQGNPNAGWKRLAVTTASSCLSFSKELLSMVSTATMGDELELGLTIGGGVIALFNQLKSCYRNNPIAHEKGVDSERNITMLEVPNTNKHASKMETIDGKRVRVQRIDEEKTFQQRYSTGRILTKVLAGVGGGIGFALAGPAGVVPGVKIVSKGVTIANAGFYLYEAGRNLVQKRPWIDFTVCSSKAEKSDPLIDKAADTEAGAKRVDSFTKKNADLM